mmetsp:Transcript_58576/g.80357  ORF Transcript_58576/g.80357 Transcript_58576/m.80357 type:complete len:379 (+) Transcript_58576:135-1271(+)
MKTWSQSAALALAAELAAQPDLHGAVGAPRPRLQLAADTAVDPVLQRRRAAFWDDLLLPSGHLRLGTGFGQQRDARAGLDEGDQRGAEVLLGLAELVCWQPLEELLLGARGLDRLLGLGLRHRGLAAEVDLELAILRGSQLDLAPDAALDPVGHARAGLRRKDLLAPAVDLWVCAGVRHGGRRAALLPLLHEVEQCLTQFHLGVQELVRRQRCEERLLLRGRGRRRGSRWATLRRRTPAALALLALAGGRLLALANQSLLALASGRLLALAKRLLALTCALGHPPFLHPLELLLDRCLGNLGDMDDLLPARAKSDLDLTTNAAFDPCSNGDAPWQECPRALLKRREAVQVLQRGERWQSPRGQELEDGVPEILLLRRE